MDNVVSSYHTNIIDASREQFLLLSECDADRNFTGAYYLSSDGDFSLDEGATFVDELNSGSEYVVGCIPSRTMNVTLMNLDGHLNGHNFGWLDARVGVYMSRTGYTPAVNENCRSMGSGGDTMWQGRTDGLYNAGTTRVATGNVVGILRFENDSNIYYCTESGGTLTMNSYQTGSTTPKTLPSFIADKLVNKGIFIKDVTLFITANGLSNLYSMAGLGHFRVDRPKKTMGKTVSITDAFDLIHELDVDAASAIVGYTITDGYNLFKRLVENSGMTIAYSDSAISTALSAIPVDTGSLLNNSYSSRGLASYLLAAVGANARLKPRSKTLQVYYPNDQVISTTYKVPATRIEANGLEMQEFSTGTVDAVAVKALSNVTTTYPTSGGTYLYEYDGNPFVFEASSSLITNLTRIPVYKPMTVKVLEADPSFQCGDILTVNDGTQDYAIPIMAQNLTWKGVSYATIEAKGTEGRKGDSYVSYTDTNSRTSKYISADYISSGYISADRIQAGTISMDKLTSTTQAGLVASSQTKTQYYLSTSSSTATGGSWVDTVPAWSSGKYIWTRTVTTETKASGATSTSYAPSEGGTYDSNLTTALSSASSAQSTANGANSMEQTIYISKASGTSSVAGTTTWVTNITGNQNTWTTKRPVYNTNYPVLFVATQRKTVGGTVTCTDPTKDDTTTVIDGGHITTGTIDASVANITNINASNITTGTLTGINLVSAWDNGNQVTVANGEVTLKRNDRNAYVDLSATSGMMGLHLRDNSFADAGRFVYNTTADNAELWGKKLFIQGENSLEIDSDAQIKIGDHGLAVTGATSVTGALSATGNATLGGNASITGSLTMNGHDSKVGTVVREQLSSAVTLPAQTNACTAVVSKALTTGLWLVWGYCRFAANSATRRLVLNVTDVSGQYTGRIRNDMYSSSNDDVWLECSGYLEVPASASPQTFYLNAMSSVASSAKATYTQFTAVRLL